MKKSTFRYLKPIAALLLTMTLALLAIGFSLCKSSNHPVTPPGHMKSLVRVEMTEVPGTTTVAWIFDIPSDKGFVLAHGNSSDRNSMVARALWLNSLGYSVVIPDLHAHGETKGRWKTFGYLESRDVENSILYLRKRLGKHWVGGLGASLGGASILKAESDNGGFDAVIIESVFSDIRTAVRNRLETRFGRLGSWLEPVLTWQLPMWAGISRDELRPVKWAEAVKCPILVLNGDRDSRAKAWEADAIFQRVPVERKRLEIFKGAGHEDLSEANPEKYRRDIQGFLAGLD
jgi:alpha-beta hydrolase superfamily lysophospholipase